MATSSIFADFTIQNNKQAEAFFKAIDQSRANPRPKRRCKAKFVTSPKELKALCKRISKKNA